MLRLLIPFAIITALSATAHSHRPAAALCPDTDSIPSDSVAVDSVVIDSVVIDKGAMTLTAYLDSVPVAIFECATGANPGDKVMEGDCRTPEGRFFISEIVDASDWTHDFGDGQGEIEGCYGPWFLRLHTPPHTGIGIHGTHLPGSLGSRASEGCIRLLNENVDSLRHMVVAGTPVTVIPGAADLKANLIQALEKARLDSLAKIAADSLTDTITPLPLMQ